MTANSGIRDVYAYVKGVYRTYLLKIHAARAWHGCQGVNMASWKPIFGSVWRHCLSLQALLLEKGLLQDLLERPYERLT